MHQKPLDYFPRLRTVDLENYSRKTGVTIEARDIKITRDRDPCRRDGTQWHKGILKRELSISSQGEHDIPKRKEKRLDYAKYYSV